MKKWLMILLFTFVFVGILGFALADNNNSNKDNEEGGLFCTQEAKSCSDGSYVSRNSSNDCKFNLCPGEDEDHELVGSSCGTVTPGENNECCINKGYKGWDNETFRCIGEEESDDKIVGGALGAHQEENKMECEAWNCTKWGPCINGNETRACAKNVLNCTTDFDKPRTMKKCNEKEQLKIYNKTNECPKECTCSGSTVKCTFENGTRIMTVYAGKSGNIIVQIKDANVSTSVTLYKEDGKMYGTFKGNKTHEIMFPDEVLGELQNRTRTRLYNASSMNLTDEGYYQIEGKKKSRLFWIISVKERMKAEVNAETGETVKIRNPWWGFLAKDIKED
jgi:hypothetical protein